MSHFDVVLLQWLMCSLVIWVSIQAGRTVALAMKRLIPVWYTILPLFTAGFSVTLYIIALELSR